MANCTVERPEAVVTLVMTETEARALLNVADNTTDNPFRMRVANSAVYPVIRALLNELA